MAVAIRSSTSLAGSNRTNSTLSAPSGLADNDILLAIIVAGDGNDTTAPTVTPPAGFTAASGNPYQISKADPYAVGYNLFWKKAQSESGSYTFTHGAADSEGRLIALTGADLVAPLAPTPTTNSGVSFDPDNNATALSITPTVDGSMVFFVSQSWDTPSSLTPPTGSTPTFTTVHNLGSGFFVASGVLATAGATGDKTAAVLGGFNNPWVASLAVIEAATNTPAAAKTRISTSAKGAIAGRMPLVGKATISPKAKAVASIPLNLAAATRIRSRASGSIINYLFLQMQTRFFPAMRGAINGAVGISTSAAATGMFRASAIASRAAVLVGKATSSATVAGGGTGGTLLTGMAKVASSRAKSTFSGSVILAIQTQILPAMRGALNSAVLPTSVALASTTALINRAKGALAGTTALAARTSLTSRASDGLSAAAFIATKTATHMKGGITATARSALAAATSLKASSRGSMVGVLGLLGRSALSVTSSLGLPGSAIALLARATAAARIAAGVTSRTPLAGRSAMTLKAAVVPPRLAALLSSLAGIAVSARAGVLVIANITTTARATLAIRASASFSGVLGLTARTKMATTARIARGFMPLRGLASAGRMSASALLFVLKPIIPTPVYTRPGRLGRLRASLEKAFGEEFDIEPMTANVDVNSRVLPDISRDPKIDVIGIWQGPTTSRAPTARGSTADDKAHNWNASFPSVRFDDAAIAGVMKGDKLTRKLDGAVYWIVRVVPDGFGRTTVQLTARQRTTN